MVRGAVLTWAPTRKRESWRVVEDLELHDSLSFPCRGHRPVSPPLQPMTVGKVAPGKRLKRGLPYFYCLHFINLTFIDTGFSSSRDLVNFIFVPGERIMGPL